MGMNCQLLKSHVSPGRSADLPTSFLDYVRKSTGHVEFTVKNIVCFNIICKLVATHIVCTNKMYNKVTYIDTVVFFEREPVVKYLPAHQWI
jgi:hypothetical protein